MATNFRSSGWLCQNSRASPVATSPTKKAMVYPPAKAARQSPSAGNVSATGTPNPPPPPPKPPASRGATAAPRRKRAPPERRLAEGARRVAATCCPKGVPGRRMKAMRLLSGDQVGLSSKSVLGDEVSDRPRLHVVDADEGVVLTGAHEGESASRRATRLRTALASPRLDERTRRLCPSRSSGRARCWRGRSGRHGHEHHVPPVGRELRSDPARRRPGFP